jgi:hypothetical protein
MTRAIAKALCFLCNLVWAYSPQITRRMLSDLAEAGVLIHERKGGCDSRSFTEVQ